MTTACSLEALLVFFRGSDDDLASYVGYEAKNNKVALIPRSTPFDPRSIVFYMLSNSPKMNDHIQYRRWSVMSREHARLLLLNTLFIGRLHYDTSSIRTIGNPLFGMQTIPTLYFKNLHVLPVPPKMSEFFLRTELTLSQVGPTFLPFLRGFLNVCATLQIKLSMPISPPPIF